MSGIYIPGMEMPPCCYLCPARNRGYSGDGMRCYLTKENIGWHAGQLSRGALCPLVAVPQHGRLIDADALLKEGPDYEYPLIDTDGSFDCCTPCFDIDSIKNAPTIIPAEEADHEQ